MRAFRTKMAFCQDAVPLEMKQTCHARPFRIQISRDLGKSAFCVRRNMTYVHRNMKSGCINLRPMPTMQSQSADKLLIATASGLRVSPRW
jgi:hypothetical protein